MDDDRIWEITERLFECQQIMFENDDEVEFLINIVAATYLVILGLTVRKYRTYFTGVNFYLCLFWTIESLWAISFLVRDFTEF